MIENKVEITSIRNHSGHHTEEGTNRPKNKVNLRYMVDEIHDVIKSDFIKNNLLTTNGLLDGKAGISLFLCHYINYNDQASDFTNIFLKSLVDNLFKETSTHSFSVGLAGILYLFEYLDENDFVEIDVNQKQLDSYLMKKLEIEFTQNHYDYLHGILGLSLYFYKRKIVEPVIRTVEYLSKTLIEDDKTQPNNSHYWKSTIGMEDGCQVNISLSHGIASIVRFLCLVHSNKDFGMDLSGLISGAVNFLLSQKHISNDFGCVFPSQSLERPDSSRLAWCYGDLGIAVTIWYAGKTLKQPKWQKDAEQILLSSTERRRYEQTFISDGSLCHGSSGLCLIFHRMFLNTGNKRFMNSAQYWLDVTIKYAREKLNELKFEPLENKTNEQRCMDYGLLYGISGIGLTLLSIVDPVNQHWDEMLLLSP